LSLAKDHNNLDAVAIIPIAAAVIRTMIKAVMTVEPTLLLVAWTKIPMKGKLVGLFKALSMFPRQNNRAIWHLGLRSV